MSLQLIQNRKYGNNANPNYEYKADVFSPHQIHIGQNVTQRTDFKAVEVQQNANLHCKAAESIHLKSGFHAKAGSSFHAEIKPYSCSTTKSQSVTNTNGIDTENLIVTQSPTKYSNTTFNIYPNPSNGNVNIEFNNATQFSFKVFNVAGKLIKNGIGSKRINLNLQKGIYIIVVEYDNIIEKEKLIIY